MTEMLFRSIVEEVVAKSFATFMSQERKDEIEEIGKYWNYYYGYQQQYIKQYEGESDIDYKDKDKPTFNYTKMVVDEYVAGVFGREFTVKIDDKKQQEIWNEAQNEMSFFNKNPFFMKVQRIAEISDTCVVMVRWNDETKQFYFEDIRGEFVVFLPDKDHPKQIGTMIISYVYDNGDPNIDEKYIKRIEIWDKENWAIWQHNAAKRKTELIETGENPYGCIPAVRFQPDEDDNTFYGLSGVGDIVNINEIYNNLWTALMRTCVNQSFSILMTRSEGDLDIKIGPKSFINFENSENGDAKFITPSPLISEVEKVLQDLRSELQDFTKIPSYVFASSKEVPMSGYALQIRRIPIEQLWNQRKLSYGQSLVKLIDLSLKVNAINNNEEYTKPNIVIDFEEPDYIANLTEQQILDERNMRYGLISPVDILIRDNPDLTRDEAKEIIKRNQEEIKELNIVEFGEMQGEEAF